MQAPFDSAAFIRRLSALLKKHGKPEAATGAAAYMRNQFAYFGVSTPERRRLYKAFLQEQGLPPKAALPDLVKEMWDRPQRELQYCAMELCLLYKKSFVPGDLALFEQLITTKSWWDTVDFIAPKLCAELFMRHPEIRDKAVRRWVASKNIWLMRSAIIFQLGAKQKTDTALLFDVIRKTAHEKEFFIRKGIGWALRQYSYVDPDTVEAFIGRTPLSSLSVREGMKAILRARNPG